MIATKRNKILAILTLTVILIWGLIGYRVYSFFMKTDNDNIEIISENSFNKMYVDKKNNSSEKVEFSYSKLNRDPFTFNKTTSSNYISKERTKQPPVIITPLRNNPPVQKTEYRINGAIINDNSRLVIFEDLTNNKTLFLKEGEAYNEITIKEIGKKSVTVVVEGKDLKEILLQ